METKLDLEPITLPGVELARPMVIAGPCSAETEEQVMNTARELAANGVKIFRAGIWKPRTRPGAFEGIGSEGLAWMQRVKKETGMFVSTEVATAHHVHEAIKYGVDLLWIGARTTANPFAVQEIADALRGTNIPVFVKNPVNPDLELWIGAFERLNRAGIKKLGAIHRGFSTYEKTKYRNHPMWQIPIELHRRIPDLPIITDPSHITGDCNLIQDMSQEAMDMNFDGLIIESHECPAQAWSDAKQQITPTELKEALDSLIIRETVEHTENLSELRQQIDEIDNKIIEILAKRMRISKEIAQYKKDHDMPVLQAGRYDEILTRRSQQGAQLEMSEEFIKEVFEAIHGESVRHQMQYINKWS